MSGTFAALAFLSLATPTLRAHHSIARIWDEQLLDAIRIDVPHPPKHARNLYSLSVAMFDAWCAYDPAAVGVVYTNKHTATDIVAARRQAISHAAYRLLRSRFARAFRPAVTAEALDDQMAILGYDIGFTSEDPATPAGLGNLVFRRVHEHFLTDGSLEERNYQDLPPCLPGDPPTTPDQCGYRPLNLLSLLINTTGTLATDVNRWQPLAITDAVTQNGIPAGAIQTFVGSQWLFVRPFALTRANPYAPWLDPGPPPQLTGQGDAEFRSNVVAVIRASSELTPDDGATMDISPGAMGNNPLGENSGTGHPINPVTGQPYAPNIVKRGDFARCIAEYWADGPHSETPPGHWNVIANEVVEHPLFRRRIGGVGPELDPLEWDVKMYLALNAAVHDAACAAWGVKRYYDGWRPITAIRFMGQLGQNTDTNDLSYHPDGLPLIPDLIELATPETSGRGGRHFGVPAGVVALKVWPRQVADPRIEYAGVKWTRADYWWPFQQRSFVSPAFPGYVSGHSTFSRAAAEIMTALTGSPYFPGGLHTVTFAANQYLRFELGPSETVVAQYATYYDAADMAGRSRIWGGIHPPVDDFGGRRMGAQVGHEVWDKVRRHIAPSAPPEVIQVRTTIRLEAGGLCAFTFDAAPGFHYRLQHTASLDAPFADTAPASTPGVAPTLTLTHSPTGGAGFYRVLRSTAP